MGWYVSEIQAVIGAMIIVCKVLNSATGILAGAFIRWAVIFALQR